MNGSANCVPEIAGRGSRSATFPGRLRRYRRAIRQQRAKRHTEPGRMTPTGSVPRAKQLRGKPAACGTPEDKSTAGFLKVDPVPLKGPAGTASGAAAQTGSEPPPPAPRRLPPKSDRRRATRAAACPAAGCSAAGIDPGVACRIQGFPAPRPQAPAKSIATGWVAPNPGYAKTNIRMFDASAGTRSSCRRSMPRFNARTASLSQCSPRLAFWRLE